MGNNTLYSAFIFKCKPMTILWTCIPGRGWEDGWEKQFVYPFFMVARVTVCACADVLNIVQTLINALFQTTSDTVSILYLLDSNINSF